MRYESGMRRGSKEAGFGDYFVFVPTLLSFLYDL